MSRGAYRRLRCASQADTRAPSDARDEAILAVRGGHERLGDELHGQTERDRVDGAEPGEPTHGTGCGPSSANRTHASSDPADRETGSPFATARQPASLAVGLGGDHHRYASRCASRCASNLTRVPPWPEDSQPGLVLDVRGPGRRLHAPRALRQRAFELNSRTRAGRIAGPGWSSTFPDLPMELWGVCRFVGAVVSVVQIFLRAQDLLAGASRIRLHGGNRDRLRGQTGETCSPRTTHGSWKPASSNRNHSG
jgi:hypothetical protein